MLKIVWVKLALILLSQGIYSEAAGKAFKLNKRIGVISSDPHSEATNQISRDTGTHFEYGDRSVHSDVYGGGNQYSTNSYQRFGQPNAYQYSIYPYETSPTGVLYSNAGVEAYSTPEESNGSWLCRTFGGICGENTRQDALGSDTLGILGLIAVGLKKLKLLKFAPVLPLLIPFLPIILPLLIIIAIPVLVVAWFLPVIPIVVVGRNISVSAVRNVQEVLESENCLERISCEASRISRGLGFEAPWVKQFLERASPHSKWAEKISRGGRSSSCISYSCRSIAALQKALKIKSE